MRTLIVPLVAILSTGVALAQMKQTPPATKQGGVTTATPQGGASPIVTSLTPQAINGAIEMAKRIHQDEAIKLASQKKAIYVDVRSLKSFTAGHIKGAISLPLSQIEGDFAAALRRIPPGMTVITYCACKEAEHTSARAVLDLNAHGFKNAAALTGGWNAWIAAGLPTETGAQ